MTKILEVTIDLIAARKMLSVANYDTENLSDEEVFNLALAMNEIYGVTYNSIDNTN